MSGSRTYIIDITCMKFLVDAICYDRFCFKSAPPKHQNVHQLSPRTTSHEHAFVAPGWLVGILRLLNLPDHEIKRLADILIVPRAGLGVCALELLGQLFPLLQGDLALVGT